ncbi:ABC-F family ATP-binding cassette domain-containing protein [Peptococcaceae bacterium 1198_IL3148]
MSKLILLQASHIVKSYGAKTILSDVTLTVQSGERVGLVGINGAGKSTLMKILAGDLTCDAGEVIKPKEISVGYLSQDSGLHSDNSIYQELIAVFQPLISMEQQLRKLEQQIADSAVDGKGYQQLLDNYAKLSDTFKDKGGYSYQATTRSVMHGLGLTDLGYDTAIKSLSGGQKTLVALAKLLLQSPDVLMLDEPTNYLDINTLNWLEQYLKSYPGAMLVISHDRYLLDTLTNIIYELERNKIVRYAGNYSKYLELKAEQLEQQLKQYNKQMTEVAKLQEFVQRNLARASTTKRAQSRRRMLEKMELQDKPEVATKRANFNFDVKVQSGKEVLKLRDLSIGYADKTLSSGINLLIERGESVALVGPNGVGKSTLLKTVLNFIKPKFGSIYYGTNVQIAYYDQEQANLQGNKQVLNELWDQYPLMNEKNIRTVLGNFLFSGEDVLKRVADLSGGEKARLALAKMLLQRANLLILDEPTNHLDIYSREVLENALTDFPGTIIFVSHDRYFINRVATRIIELNKNGVESFLGDYDYYLLKKQEQQPTIPEPLQIANIQDEQTTQKDKENYYKSKEIKRLERQRQRKIDELQQLITEQEQLIAKLEADLCKPEVYKDHNRCQEVNETLTIAKEKLDEYLTAWVELEEEVATN